MKLILSPIRMDQRLSAEVAGDVLTLNGSALDFTTLPLGAILPRAAVDNPWIAGDIWRDARGMLHVPLVLPHGADAAQDTLFPSDLTLGDGPVPLPAFSPEDAHAED